MVMMCIALLPAMGLSAMKNPPAVATHSPFATKALGIVSAHPIVQSNPYTEWFAEGHATIPQVCLEPWTPHHVRSSRHNSR